MMGKQLLVNCWSAVVFALLLTAISGCNEGGAPAPAAEVAAKPAPQVEPPDSQEVSVNLIYAGEVEGTDNVGFDFRVLWGEWKNNQKTLEMASNSPQATQLDLGCVDAKVVPVFPGGQKGQYVVKINDKAGKLMGEFEILDTGKQVKLSKASTKGYSQRLVFFDPDRYLTAYRVQERDGSKLGKEIGVMFVGEGWRVVDQSKKQVIDGKFQFPKVNMIILPPEWMELNEIDHAYRTLKRGKDSPAGVCYSCS